MPSPKSVLLFVLVPQNVICLQKCIMYKKAPPKTCVALHFYFVFSDQPKLWVKGPIVSSSHYVFAFSFLLFTPAHDTKPSDTSI